MTTSVRGHQPTLAEVIRAFRVLGHPGRYAVLLAISERPAAVKAIAERTTCKRSMVDNHLLNLQAAGLAVRCEARGMHEITAFGARMVGVVGRLTGGRWSAE